MTPRRAVVNERTFYIPLMDIIRGKGGDGAQEVQYNSVPDIVFDLRGHRWLLSVKLGEDPRTMKQAFVQYLRHKEETGTQQGMLVILPDSLRAIKPEPAPLRTALDLTTITVLIDALVVKEELRDRNFASVLDFLLADVLPRIQREEQKHYPLSLVVSLLQAQVTETMDAIRMDEHQMMRILTDTELLAGIGHLNADDAQDVAKFLASYVILSQILFLRLLANALPDRIPVERPITHRTLRHSFRRVLDINYRSIFNVDVLDSVREGYLSDTFDLIWGLQIEKVRHELPGRLFHQLMPEKMRKMLAAFYTRPLAADLLARLCIRASSERVFDPASGSGTILTSAYRRKLELHRAEALAGNPHRRFCEEEIFGCDVMPFAVHLTSANLSAMDPATTLSSTQVIQGDSLQLDPGPHRGDMQGEIFPMVAEAQDAYGDARVVELGEMDTILMNPPFTKVERGIKDFVNMDRFKAFCGGEVGLWGHFIKLADTFLRNDGIYGAVLPINILRGRESDRVRQILFNQWTPLYIIKPTFNYGFSEDAEYRDVLVIAKKRNPIPDELVKFALIKKDLHSLDQGDIEEIARGIEDVESLRSDPLVEVASFTIAEVQERFDNMMWFCGVTDFSRRDTIVGFIDKFRQEVSSFPPNYFREGFRPVPKGVSKFLFMTRDITESRVEEAFLRFHSVEREVVRAKSGIARFDIPLECVVPSLRTGVGLDKMDITNQHDFVAKARYPEYGRVCRAAGVEQQRGDFWAGVERDLQRVRTNLVTSHRINPFSPSVIHNAFFSRNFISPSNQLNVVVERDPLSAKAVCVLLNSILFYAQFILLKEESTGRFINIRFYDLYSMKLYPVAGQIAALADVFDSFGGQSFPALSLQLDRDFTARYEEFWESQNDPRQIRLFTVLETPIHPAQIRLDFDKAICEALGVRISVDELTQVYTAIVQEMFMIRGLTRD